MLCTMYKNAVLLLSADKKNVYFSSLGHLCSKTQPICLEPPGIIFYELSPSVLKFAKTARNPRQFKLASDMLK